MARKPENSFRQGIHKYLPVGLHHEKMNNPYSSGTPDDWYSGNRSDLWVEYKYLPKVPLRAEIVPTKLLSPLQLQWLNGRYSEGRTIALVIGCPEGGVILCDQEWMHSYTAQMFRDRLVPRRDIAQWIAQTTTR